MWGKIDDSFAWHPKILKAGPLAGWMFIAGLCYCNRHLTNGKIPKAAVPSLANWSGIGVFNGMHGEDVTPEMCENQLTSVGLWDDKEDHFLVHDYRDFNFTKRQVQLLRAQWRRRQSKHRAKLSRRDSRVNHPLPVPVLSKDKRSL